MRKIFRLLVLAPVATAACATKPVVTNSDTAEFQQVAEAFQQLYTGGSENCARITQAVSEDVTLVENNETWGYAQLVEFCPHLPRKNVVSSWSDRMLIGPTLGYDFATLIYENESGVPRRETSVRVWQKSAHGWRIIRMSSVLSAIALEGNPM